MGIRAAIECECEPVCAKSIDVKVWEIRRRTRYNEKDSLKGCFRGNLGKFRVVDCDY